MKHQELARLQKQYDNLPDHEKIRRLEVVGQYYLSMLTNDAQLVVDLTKYYQQIEEVMIETGEIK